jgi:hypothetical protein
LPVIYVNYKFHIFTSIGLIVTAKKPTTKYRLHADAIFLFTKKKSRIFLEAQLPQNISGIYAVTSGASDATTSQVFKSAALLLLFVKIKKSKVFLCLINYAPRHEDVWENESRAQCIHFGTRWK